MEAATCWWVGLGPGMAGCRAWGWCQTTGGEGQIPRQLAAGGGGLEDSVDLWLSGASAWGILGLMSAQWWAGPGPGTSGGHAWVPIWLAAWPGGVPALAQTGWWAAKPLALTG